MIQKSANVLAPNKQTKNPHKTKIQHPEKDLPSESAMSPSNWLPSNHLKAALYFEFWLQQYFMKDTTGYSGILEFLEFWDQKNSLDISFVSMFWCTKFSVKEQLFVTTEDILGIPKTLWNMAVSID